MGDKELFAVCGAMLIVAIIASLFAQDFWVFTQIAGVPIGIMAGWAVVILIESHKGGKHGNNK